MTVVDSIKCRFANSGVTDQVGGFKNPGVCLQAFPSFLPHPLPALLLASLFSRSLTLVRGSFLLNPTETLAMQAREKLVEVFLKNVFLILFLHFFIAYQARSRELLDRADTFFCREIICVCLGFE